MQSNQYSSLRKYSLVSLKITRVFGSLNSTLSEATIHGLKQYEELRAIDQCKDSGLTQ